MQGNKIKKTLISELLNVPVGQGLQIAFAAFEKAQQYVKTLKKGEDGIPLTLLRAGTIFQLFFLKLYASGKHPGEISADEWQSIAEKVMQSAAEVDGRDYSGFVFSMYAQYIEKSADQLKGIASENQILEIKRLSGEIASCGIRLERGEITEVDYTEKCLWLSLEGMFKLLSSYLGAGISVIAGDESGQLVQAVMQLSLECGRYVLYEKEQSILAEYLNNQKLLDERLQADYDAFLSELQEKAMYFQSLVDVAFSADFHEVLLRSAELARAAGVKEEELIETEEEVDSFFMD